MDKCKRDLMQWRQGRPRPSYEQLQQAQRDYFRAVEPWTRLRLRILDSVSFTMRISPADLMETVYHPTPEQQEALDHIDQQIMNLAARLMRF